MNHSFKVGGTYRNRKGEYEVLELNGPKMVIRYVDGPRLDTTVKLQARIWKHIQAEEEIESRREASASDAQSVSRGGLRGRRFDGLHDHDFKKGVAGTHWRARTGLGGLLAQTLSTTSGRFFQSYAIYRRAEVHIAQPSCYDAKAKWRQAKFVFHLDSEGATYGFYIEKNDGPMDATWDWARFLAALNDEPEVRRQIESAHRKLGLHWTVYVWDDGALTAEAKASPTGSSWRWQGSDGSQELQWPGFTQRLEAIGADKWCDLYFCTSLAKEQAIAAGLQIVEPVTEVYRALLPLYAASARRAGEVAGP